jgi:4-diphosphocytidyl-2-C-methyl-D-erythritol kinase
MMYFYIKQNRMITFPISKVNIGLRITGKRADGYHNIETLFCPVPLCDALEFVEAEDKNKGDRLTVTGIDTLGEIKDNLVMKAVKKLREKNNFPILKMHLHKAIPAGAGLGGGSSDAAFILKGINRCYGLKLDNETLRAVALELGSDCPFFIDCTPSYATGRGEILVPCEKNLLKNHHLLLLNPGVEINTREAYKYSRPGRPSASLHELIEMPSDKWKDHIVNDFEEYAFHRHPQIMMLKEELYRAGALFSLMSGSGSTVFGIFKRRPQLPEELREYVIWQGAL